MSDKKDIRTQLQEPFKPNEIEWRVQSQGKNATGGKVWCQVFAYIDARALQNRLDDIFTPFGWEDKYEPLGDDFICTLTVEYNGKKVSKQNGASKSQVEGFKGGISNSFKRVCASGFGIGRYLYDLDVMFAETSLEKQTGDEWKRGSFKDKNASSYTTYWWKIPKLPKEALPSGEKPKKTITNEMILQLEELIKKSKADREKYLIAIGVQRLEDLEMSGFADAVKQLNNKIAVNLKKEKENEK